MKLLKKNTPSASRPMLKADSLHNSGENLFLENLSRDSRMRENWSLKSGLHRSWPAGNWVTSAKNVTIQQSIAQSAGTCKSRQDVDTHPLGTWQRVVTNGYCWSHASLFSRRQQGELCTIWLWLILPGSLGLIIINLTGSKKMLLEVV